MSDKTKKYRWLPWALAVAIVFAIGLIGWNYANWYILAPWEPARSLVTRLSIDAFSAGIDYSTFIQDAGSYWNLRLTALLAIVLTFVVGPSLWIYAEIKNQGNASGDVLKKGIAWYTGVILVVASLQVVPTTIIKGVVFQNTWDSTEQSKAKDLLRSDLMKLGYDALELYHLPNEFGGGAGSFQLERANGEVNPLQLTDLESHSQLNGYSYTLAPVESDSVIRIQGISDLGGTDPDVENPDESKDKLQMDLVVQPPANFEFEEGDAL